jgi:hypothetical protein
MANAQGWAVRRSRNARNPVLNLPKVKPTEATMKFVSGQRLSVQERPEWGIGEVQNVINDEKILVCFDRYGQRELTLTKWQVVLVEGEEAESARLDRLLALSQNTRTAPRPARRFGKATGSSQTTPIAGNADFLELSDAIHAVDQAGAVEARVQGKSFLDSSRRHLQ